MKEELPIIRIHETDFYVDLRQMQFTEIKNPSNTISFENVQDNGDHCLILFDTTTKNAFQGTFGELTASPYVVQVRLPGLHDLDPVKLAQIINEQRQDFLLQAAKKIFKELKTKNTRSKKRK